MTDDSGLLEHAVGSVPNPSEGYSLDDNARGLIACTVYRYLTGRPDVDELADRYLQFVLYCRREDGRFHNDVSYDRTFQDDTGSEDSHGRVLWGLAYTWVLPWRRDVRTTAAWLIEGLVPHLFRCHSVRGMAYSLLGATVAFGSAPAFAQLPGSHHGGGTFSNLRSTQTSRLRNSLRELMNGLASRLLEQWNASRQKGQRWVEEHFTYDDPRLAEALIRAGPLVDDGGAGDRMTRIALEGLEYLWEKWWSAEENVLCLPGNRRWHPEMSAGSAPEEDYRLAFDQQPLDAAALVDAAISAYQATGSRNWLRRAKCALEWFHGRNLHHIVMVDPSTGGCYDGLTPTGVNRNQGAESTLAYILARLTWRR